MTDHNNPMFQALFDAMAEVTAGKCDALCVVRRTDGKWIGWGTAPMGAHSAMALAAERVTYADRKRKTAAGG